MPFAQATNFDSFLRLALSGPAGCGKTSAPLLITPRVAEAMGKPMALVSASMVWIREQLADDLACIRRAGDHYCVAHLENLTDEQGQDATARLPQQAQAGRKAAAQ